MTQRGRKSEESKRFKVIEGDFAGKRPDPPADLSARQGMIWRAICDDEPLTHFSTAATQQMLRDYCFHIEQGEKVKATIDSFPVVEALKSEKGRKAYRDLSKSLDIHTNASARMATKLRLTNQSRYTPLSAATASRNTLKGIKPWEI
jgi:hypothetical protein